MLLLIKDFTNWNLEIIYYNAKEYLELPLLNSIFPFEYD